MRPNGSASLLFGGLVVLAMSSVGLKAAVGAPDTTRFDQGLGDLQQQIAQQLGQQGFTTTISQREIQSSIVFAERGACRLSVRNAVQGTSAVTVFAREATAIGPVRYLYDGKAYAAPPALKMRFDRFRTEISSRMGFRGATPVPLALATSPACDGSTFGLEELRIAI